MRKKSRVNQKKESPNGKDEKAEVKFEEKVDKDVDDKIEDRFSLYLLLQIKREATTDEIKKQYRKLVLKYHPDKNPSPQAKQQFHKLKQAYDILCDPQKRKIYDETGSLEQEGGFDEKSFQSAYEYFRAMFKKVTEQDINDFAKSYRFGPMEEEDLLNYYQQHQGDMIQLIESIPLSENNDISRFIEFFQAKIKTKLLPYYPKFNQTKTKVRILKDETQEFQQMKKQQDKAQFNQLTLAIKSKKHGHLDFIALLQQKYAKQTKKKKLQNNKPKRRKNQK